MDYRDLADRDFGGDHVGTDNKVGLDKPPTPSPGFKGVPATDAQLHCHIPGCQEAIPIVLGGKKPKRKLQTCRAHRLAASVDIHGIPHRFCQHCTRMHELSEFDGDKHSCRSRLECRNERRRKRNRTEDQQQLDQGDSQPPPQPHATDIDEKHIEAPSGEARSSLSVQPLVQDHSAQPRSVERPQIVGGNVPPFGDEDFRSHSEIMRPAGIRGMVLHTQSSFTGPKVESRNIAAAYETMRRWESQQSVSTRGGDDTYQYRRFSDSHSSHASFDHFARQPRRSALGGNFGPHVESLLHTASEGYISPPSSERHCRVGHAHSAHGMPCWSTRSSRTGSDRGTCNPQAGRPGMNMQDSLDGSHDPTSARVAGLSDMLQRDEVAMDQHFYTSSSNNGFGSDTPLAHIASLQGLIHSEGSRGIPSGHMCMPIHSRRHTTYSGMDNAIPAGMAHRQQRLPPTSHQWMAHLSESRASVEVIPNRSSALADSDQVRRKSSNTSDGHTSQNPKTSMWP